MQSIRARAYELGDVSPLLTRESLLEQYDEQAINILGSDQNSWTARQVWDLMHEALRHNNQALEATRKELEDSKKEMALQEEVFEITTQNMQKSWNKEKQELQGQLYRAKMTNPMIEQSRLAQREAQTLTRDRDNLAEKLKKTIAENRALSTSVATLKEQKDSLNTHMDDLSVKIKVRNSSLERERKWNEELRDELRVMHLYKCCLVLIGDNFDEESKEPRTVAKSVLNKLETMTLRLRNVEDVEMTDSNIQALSSRVQQLNACAVKDAEERSSLEGRLSQEQYNHALTRRELKEECKDGLREIHQLEQRLKGKNSHIREIDAQLIEANAARDETKEEVQRLRQEEADLKQIIKDQDGLLKELTHKLDAANTASSLVETIRRLLISSKDFNLMLGGMAFDALSEYKRFRYWEREGPELLVEATTWSLEMGSILKTSESFEQLTARFRALVMFDVDRDVLARLDLLETLIDQLSQCQLEDLINILDMLYVGWISTGRLQLTEELLTVNYNRKPQSALQVLFEARLLELLLRGIEVVESGWTSIATAINYWSAINKSTIKKNLILQGYEIWFKNLDQSNQKGVPKHVWDIVSNNDTSLSCSDNLDYRRVLIAPIMADFEYCMLYDDEDFAASLYASSDLEYNIRHGVVTFPNRDRRGGMVKTEAPFHEPRASTQRFVREEMGSLFGRGSWF